MITNDTLKKCSNYFSFPNHKEIAVSGQKGICPGEIKIRFFSEFCMFVVRND